MIRFVAWVAPLFVMVSIALSGPVAAQFMPQSTGSSQGDVVPAPSPNDVKEFLRLLSDPSVQDWLRKNAQATPDASGQGQAMSAEQIRARLKHFAQRATTLALAWQILPEVPSVLTHHWDEELSKSQKVRSLTYVLTFLLIGFGLEWLFRQNLQMTLLRIEQARSESLREKLLAALSRAAIILAGLVLFAVGSIGAFSMFEWHPLMESIVLDFLVLVVSLRAVIMFSLFLQAPYAPELRLVPYNTALAKRLHLIVRVLATCTGLAITLSVILSQISSYDFKDADMGLAALAQTVAFAVVVCGVAIGCIYVGFYSAQRLAKTPPRAGVVSFWRGYSIALVVLLFAAWLIGAIGAMWVLAVVGLVVPGLRLQKAWIDHFFDQATETLFETHQAEAQAQLDAFNTREAEGSLLEGEALPEVPEFYDPYVATRAISQRVARFVLLIVALFSLAVLLGVDIAALGQDKSVVARIVVVLVNSAVAFLIADLIWTWAKAVIDKRLADYEPPVDGQAPGPEARMITLLPLLRSILKVTLLAMVTLSVLTGLGINIAPILAGAGIIGIAIGFGTQSLVRDIVAGIFFLIDDAFRLGEYVEIGDLMGTVESISIRSMRVRHHRGKVHTIPYGELKSLTNHSRDWVIMKLEFRVPFDTDLQLVKKLVKKVGAELKANEFYGESILSTLKSQGVRRMEEFNMVVGVKFMTKPGEQWLVRRDAYQKVRDIFDANGIRMAERNVKVEIGGGDHLTPAQKQAVAGAAQEAVQGPAVPPGPVPDEP